MPRGRPDPLGQVADGGRVHLVAALEILEQERPQLDEPERRLATGDDGVDARAISVVGADAAVAIAIERRGVTARTTVALAGDEIDERRFLGLLQLDPLSELGQGLGARRVGWLGDPDRSSGPRGFAGV